MTSELANQIERLSAAATFCMDHKLNGKAADQALMDTVWDNLPQIVAALNAQAEVEALRAAVLAVVAATRAYLPPDGIDAKECISRVLTATDNPTINPHIFAAERALEAKP